jgi:hypothetical protein
VQQVLVRQVDDMDGTSIADETVRFALDGVPYLIDLSAEHANEFRAAIAPYMQAARRDTGKKGSKPDGARRGHSHRESQVIRQWAAEHGFSLPPRGRIPNNVIAEYRAHKRSAA